MCTRLTSLGGGASGADHHFPLRLKGRCNDGLQSSEVGCRATNWFVESNPLPSLLTVLALASQGLFEPSETAARQALARSSKQHSLNPCQIRGGGGGGMGAEESGKERE